MTNSRTGRRSIRFPKYDYSQNGVYFITICISSTAPHLGEIKDGEVILNSFGEIAHQLWLEIPDHFPSVQLDYHVVMPDHLHGLLLLMADEGVRSDAGIARVAPGSLGVIVRSYKSAVTREINLMQNKTGVSIWQRNYWERVVRNERELAAYREYIKNNPREWELGHTL